MRRLHNNHKNSMMNSNDDNNDYWVTSDFCEINPKKTNRINLVWKMRFGSVRNF
jgi:hypothetical protein